MLCCRRLKKRIGRKLDLCPNAAAANIKVLDLLSPTEFIKKGEKIVQKMRYIVHVQILPFSPLFSHNVFDAISYYYLHTYSYNYFCLFSFKKSQEGSYLTFFPYTLHTEVDMKTKIYSFTFFLNV